MTLRRFRVVVIFLKGTQYSHRLWATIFSGCSYMLQKHTSFEGSNEQLMTSTISIFWRSTNQEGINTHIFKLCWKPMLIYLKYLLIKIKYCSYDRSYLLWEKEQRSLFKFCLSKDVLNVDFGKLLESNALALWELKWISGRDGLQSLQENLLQVNKETNWIKINIYINHGFKE